MVQVQFILQLASKTLVSQMGCSSIVWYGFRHFGSVFGFLKCYTNTIPNGIWYVLFFSFGFRFIQFDNFGLDREL